MNDQRLNKSLLIGAVLIAALLLAPYFGWRLLRTDSRKPVAYTPSRIDSPRTGSEGLREFRSKTTQRKETRTETDDKGTDHALSEVEELLK